MMETNNFIIYTDGCCLGNPGKGGIGALIFKGSLESTPVTISKGYKLTTNSRMELRAVVAALEYISTKSNITIYTDSTYVASAITNKWLYMWIKNGWKTSTRKPVKNKDLWIEMDKNISKHNVNFVWVKGHSSNIYNNKCDELANLGARSSNLYDDENYNKKEE